MQTGQKLLAVLHLVIFSFTEEIYATHIAILGLIGFGLYFAWREYLLPLWLILPFFVEGRSAPYQAVIPLALLAASAFVDIVLAGLCSANGEEAPSEQVTPIERGALAYLFSQQISTATLYAPDREAMQWVSQNTPANASLLVLTGSRSVYCDSVPEWTLGKDFGDFVQKAGAVQACVSDSVNCVLDLTKLVKYDFIYLSKTLRVDSCEPLPTPHLFHFFVEALRSNPGFDVVYETNGAIVYRSR